jgi:hypothetical protein
MGGEDDRGDDGFLLIEGWMIGQAWFPLAMMEVARVPPANDRE